jgi:hypothetical protein
MPIGKAKIGHMNPIKIRLNGLAMVFILAIDIKFRLSCVPDELRVCKVVYEKPRDISRQLQPVVSL